MRDEYWDEEFDLQPWNEVLAWQRNQLPGFLARLRGSSKFHAEQLVGVSEMQNWDANQWSQIPFVSKQDLRTAQQTESEYRLGRAQVVDNAAIEQVIASSGTTGTPTFFGLTKNDRAAWEFSIANMFFTAGIRSTSTVAHTVGMPMVAGGMPYADAVRRIGATLVWVGGQTPARMAEMFEKLRVDAMISTASFATFFAERLTSELGVSAQSLGMQTVIGGGEPGLAQEAIRERLRSAWNAERVSETMGLGDVMSGMWAECPAEGGMHFTAPRNVYVELIDPATGEILEWGDGVRGEAVYSTFTREATPVIRYRSRDHLEVQSVSCPCGRTSPRIRCIGRTDDMLIYKAMNVFPSAIRDVILDVASAEVTGHMRLLKTSADQVRFDDPIPCEVESERVGEEAIALKQKLEEAVRQQLRVRIAVRIVPVGELPIHEYKNALVHVSG